MMRILSLSALLLEFAALASCAKLGLGGTNNPAEPANPFGSTGIPPQLRAKPTASGIPVKPGGNSPADPLTLTPENEIVFTDPDNPDENLPEMTAMLSTPKHGPWEESENLAKQRAAREGKPLLIWFNDASNPFCKALSQELLATPDFEKWANEKIVRLRVDAQPQIKDTHLSLDEKESLRVDLKNYLARMKKTYKALGYPSLFMLNPSGEVIGRYRGYKRGEADYLWGQLKHAEAASAAAYQAWRTILEKKGYRQWQDRKGRQVFAKLTRYTNGTLTLIEPDGTRCRTQESVLSDKDLNWITEQKKIRNLQ